MPDLMTNRRTNVANGLSTIRAWSVSFNLEEDYPMPVEMVRVLITVEPRMYREAIAFAVQRARPGSEVMLAPEESLDAQV
jgi:hypothetical protein